jgi:hypothetical protein
MTGSACAQAGWLPSKKQARAKLKSWNAGNLAE